MWLKGAQEGTYERWENHALPLPRIKCYARVSPSYCSFSPPYALLIHYRPELHSSLLHKVSSHAPRLFYFQVHSSDYWKELVHSLYLAPFQVDGFLCSWETGKKRRTRSRLRINLLNPFQRWNCASLLFLVYELITLIRFVYSFVP